MVVKEYSFLKIYLKAILKFLKVNEHFLKKVIIIPIFEQFPSNYTIQSMKRSKPL